MNKTPKLDECRRMIREVKVIGHVCSPRPPIPDALRDYKGNYKGYDKEKILQIERKYFQRQVYWAEYCLIINTFRLLPVLAIARFGDGSFKKYKGMDMPDSFSVYADEHLGEYDKQLLWYVLTEYDPITLDCLEEEFRVIAPHWESIPSCCQYLEIIYRDDLSNIPSLDFWEYSKLLANDDFMAYYNSLVKFEVAEKEEVESFILKVCKVVKWLNIVCDEVHGMYKGFMIASTDINNAGQRVDENNPLNNERVQKYFKKALEAGLMIETKDGYKWQYNGCSMASLGYFVSKVFNPKGLSPIPYKRLNSLFGVKRLDSAVDRLLIAKNPQKWRKGIDYLFDD